MSTVLLSVCVSIFIARAWHWPLVNDAALMHYVVFLMQHGLAPYRQIGDINLPGAYAPEWLSMLLAQVLHAGDAAMWRVMDAGLLVLAAAAMMKIAWRYSWFAGVFAGALFALYHGRDGIGQAGQRDLWVAVLLLWSIVLLQSEMGRLAVRSSSWRTAAFGLCLGAATTIKPTAAAFLLCLLPLLLWQSTLRARVRLITLVGAGFALPLLGAWLFLLHWDAVTAMARVLQLDLPYHASLGRATLLQLLLASSIASVQKLLGLLLIAALLAGGWGTTLQALVRRPRLAERAGWYGGPERGLLLVCTGLGLLSFIAQGKAYPYQRYPYIAFLLLFAALEFTAAVAARRMLVRVAGVAGLAFGLLLCAPSYLHATARARWSTAVSQSMEAAILAQAGPGGVAGLQGEVQCLDLITGCTDALLHLQIREATGTMYDEVLFPQRPRSWAESGELAGQDPPRVTPTAVIAGQQMFQQALLTHPPRVLVVTAWLFPQGPGRYRKLALWPWFNDYLAANYRLAEEHDFGRAENGPMGFRLYVRRPMHSDGLQ